MPTISVRIDVPGIKEILNSPEMTALVTDAGEQVAAATRSQLPPRIPVQINPHHTDRSVCTVVIAHPAGNGYQAKYGVLTKGAGAAGLTVRKKR